MPAAGLSLAAKLAAHRALFRSGLSIQAINTVRAHLSRLKGGGLARALGPRRIRLEVLSDVGAGEIGQVSSGPCSPDSGDLRRLPRVRARHGPAAAAGGARVLEGRRSGPTPGDREAG